MGVQKVAKLQNLMQSAADLHERMATPRGGSPLLL